jgi:L-lactate dehydrogenase (cytochrome)
MAGRPFVYGVGAYGERGVDLALGILRDEVDRTLALLGLSRMDAVNESCLLRPAAQSRPAGATLGAGA